MTKEMILILGGARAGKSEIAQKIAEEAEGNVLFIATAEAGDEEMSRRISAHRSKRPAHWAVREEPLEVPDLLSEAGDKYDTIILDCATLWVSNLLVRDQDSPNIQTRICDKSAELLRSYEKGTARLIVISNEVGLSVVPDTYLGRAFRDSLGKVNQLLASQADRVYMMIAGLCLDLKQLETRPHLGLDDD